MNLVNVIRKARKIFRDENNPIDAIKSIRTTTGVGLKAAKDFWDWMGYFNNFPATKLSEWWCAEHWCPIWALRLRYVARTAASQCGWRGRRQPGDLE
jgi:hypothetical protein